MVEEEKYTWEMKLDETMVANALVSGTTVRINSNAKLHETDAHALAHHELGVHLATSLNSSMQPLRILSLGCPLSTMTQEGMAILSEYLSGNLTLQRLKTLALRVIAVKSLIEDKNFRTTFLILKETYNVSDEQAYTITARVYRGGGYTKDYLYLKGFSLILNAYEHEKDFNSPCTGAGRTRLCRSCLAAQTVDPPAPRNRYQPSRWRIGQAFAGPNLKRLGDSILQAILSKLEVTKVLYQRREHAPPLFSNGRFYRTCR